MASCTSWVTTTSKIATPKPWRRWRLRRSPAWASPILMRCADERTDRRRKTKKGPARSVPLTEAPRQRGRAARGDRGVYRGNRDHGRGPAADRRIIASAQHPEAGREDRL